jgi:hypothetical protein
MNAVGNNAGEVIRTHCRVTWAFERTENINSRGAQMAVENDVVLIHFEDQPMTFGRIETILPDHKPDWFHVKILILQVPLQVVNWILRDVYINGDEFTMGGKRMRLEKVVCPDEPAPPGVEDPKGDQPVPDKSRKVISLADLKKK